MPNATLAPPAAELLDRLAAAPKPGEWVGPYRVTCSALDCARPDEVLVFSTDGNDIRWATPLDSWHHYKATGSFLNPRFALIPTMRTWMKELDAGCPPPSKEFNGDEVLGSGLAHGYLSLVAFRDRAGVTWACTPGQWRARQDAAWAAIEPEEEAPAAAPCPEPAAPCPEPAGVDSGHKPTGRRLRARMLTQVGWADGALQVGDEVELLPEHSLPDADLVAITSPKLKTWRLVARKRLDPILEPPPADPEPDHWDEVRAQVEGMASTVCREPEPDRPLSWRELGFPDGTYDPSTTPPFEEVPPPDPAPDPAPGSDEDLAAFLAAGPGPGIGNRVGEFEVVAYGIDETTAGPSPRGIVFVRHTAHGSDLRLAAPADLWGARGWNVSRTYPMDSLSAAMARLAACPAVGSRHRHHKGTVYEVVAVGCHALTLEPVVAYRPVEVAVGRPPLTWARTLLDWTRPEVLEDGEVVRRFAPADEAPDGEAARLAARLYSETFGSINRIAAAVGYHEFEADLGTEPLGDTCGRVERHVVEAARKAERFGEWSDHFAVPGAASGGFPNLMARLRHAYQAMLQVAAAVAYAAPADEAGRTPYDRRAFAEVVGRVEALARAAVPIPHLPAPGSLWKAHDGRTLTVDHVRKAPDKKLAVFFSWTQKGQGTDPGGRKEGSVTLEDWHEVAQDRQGHAVRRYAPIPAPATTNLE